MGSVVLPWTSVQQSQTTDATLQKCASASVGYFSVWMLGVVNRMQGSTGSISTIYLPTFAVTWRTSPRCRLADQGSLASLELRRILKTVDHQAPQQQGTNRNHHHHHLWFRAFKTFQNLSHWNRCEQCSKTSLANNDTCSSLAHELVAWLPVGLPAVRGHVSPPQNSSLPEKCANSCWLVSLHKISYHQIRIVHCIIVRHVIDLDLEPLEFELGIRKYKVYKYIIRN